MTRLNLNETCLLAVSGELDSAARGRLDAYLAAHPAARAHFEQLAGDIERLRSLPRPEFTGDEKRRLAGAIKQGIHQKLDEARRQELAARRRRLIYRALASISAAAAGIVIVAGILTLDRSAAETRQSARAEEIRNTVDSLAGYQQGPQLSPYDEAINNVASSIQQLQSPNPSLEGGQDSDMGNLLDALASVPSDPGREQLWDPGKY